LYSDIVTLYILVRDTIQYNIDNKRLASVEKLSDNQRNKLSYVMVM